MVELMTEKWIDRNLQILIMNRRYNHDWPNLLTFLNPTNQVYDKLDSGEEEDLNEIIQLMCSHAKLSPVPTGIYDWGIKMELEVAGQINLEKHKIRVPFQFVGKKYALGTILAHEVAHLYLFKRLLILNNQLENEMLADLTSIFLGFGKFVLNGIMTSDTLPENFKLGYLSPALVIYGYRSICKLLHTEDPYEFLIPTAVDRLQYA